MANGVPFIAGVQGFRTVRQPFADAATMQGGTADPLHGQFGEQTQPYPWQEFAGKIGPFGPEIGLLADEPESQTLAAGNMTQSQILDKTPYRTHAGPHIDQPKTDDRLPDGNADYLQRSYDAHSVRTNAPAFPRASSNPQQDSWQGFYSVVPGGDMTTNTNKDGQVGPQAFGFGVNDHVSNDFPKVNAYGYNMAHRHRRYATGSVPGNYMWLKPAGRPLSKTLAGPARPAIGLGPFQGDNPMATFSQHGAILSDPATSYVSPPQPYVTPATESGDADIAPVIPLW